MPANVAFAPLELLTVTASAPPLEPFPMAPLKTDEPEPLIVSVWVPLIAPLVIPALEVSSELLLFAHAVETATVIFPSELSRVTGPDALFIVRPAAPVRARVPSLLVVKVAAPLLNVRPAAEIPPEISTVNGVVTKVVFENVATSAEIHADRVAPLAVVVQFCVVPSHTAGLPDGSQNKLAARSCGPVNIIAMAAIAARPEFLSLPPWNNGGELIRGDLGTKFTITESTFIEGSLEVFWIGLRGGG